MKRCYSCKQEKDESCFNWKNKTRGIRQSYCRDCKKKYQKKYYWSSAHDRYVAQNVENKRKRREALKEKIRKYLEQHACVDCGQDDIRVLHFDHVRGKKKTEVTRLVCNGASWKAVKSEIAKCDIRCANCHMIRTWPDRWKPALSSSGLGRRPLTP